MWLKHGVIRHIKLYKWSKIFFFPPSIALRVKEHMAYVHVLRYTEKSLRSQKPKMREIFQCVGNMVWYTKCHNIISWILFFKFLTNYITLNLTNRVSNILKNFS